MYLAIQQEYTPSNNLFMRYPQDGHQQLSRRESYPNLVCFFIVYMYIHTHTHYTHNLFMYI